MGPACRHGAVLVQLGLLRYSYSSCTPSYPPGLHGAQLDALEHLLEILAVARTVFLKVSLKLVAQSPELGRDWQGTLSAQAARVEERVEQALPHVRLPVLFSSAHSSPGPVGNSRDVEADQS